MGLGCRVGDHPKQKIKEICLYRSGSSTYRLIIDGKEITSTSDGTFVVTKEIFNSLTLEDLRNSYIDDGTHHYNGCIRKTDSSFILLYWMVDTTPMKLTISVE